MNRDANVFVPENPPFGSKSTGTPLRHPAPSDSNAVAEISRVKLDEHPMTDVAPHFENVPAQPHAAPLAEALVGVPTPKSQETTAQVSHGP